jgi:hypothetical protein
VPSASHATRQLPDLSPKGKGEPPWQWSLEPGFEGPRGWLSSLDTGSGFSVGPRARVFVIGSSITARTPAAGESQPTEHATRIEALGLDMLVRLSVSRREIVAASGRGVHLAGEDNSHGGQLSSETGRKRVESLRAETDWPAGPTIHDFLNLPGRPGENTSWSRPPQCGRQPSGRSRPPGRRPGWLDISGGAEGELGDDG